MLVAPGTFYSINQVLRFARCKFPCMVVSTVHGITAEKESEAVGKHFSKARGHDGLNDVILHILEFCQTPPDATHRPHREKAERKWQFRLRSNFPFGMNKEDATPLAQ